MSTLQSDGIKKMYELFFGEYAHIELLGGTFLEVVTEESSQKVSMHSQYICT